MQHTYDGEPKIDRGLILPIDDESAQLDSALLSPQPDDPRFSDGRAVKLYIRRGYKYRMGQDGAYFFENPKGKRVYTTTYFSLYEPRANSDSEKECMERVDKTLQTDTAKWHEAYCNKTLNNSFREYILLMLSTAYDYEQKCWVRHYVLTDGQKKLS